MTQVSLPLMPPFLLATDGSISARMAQRLLYPIAHTLAGQWSRQGQPLIAVLNVQPRSPGRRHPVEADIELDVTEPEIADPADEDEASLSMPEINGTSSSQPLSPLLVSVQADFPPDLSVSFQVRQGRAATEILTYARQIHAGLIAVGHQGLGGVRELLLGSVSSAVARYADCNVLVTRGPWEELITPSWEHVLLVVNGSPATKQAIAVTRQLIPAGIRQVTVLYVQPPLTTHYLFGPFATPTPSWQLNQLLQQVQKEQSEQIIQQVRESLSLPDLKIQTLVQTSEPGPLICQIAQQQQANLIILGSDRRPAFRNIRLSATGDYTIHHAPCPVLLCRSIRSESALSE